MTDDCTVDSGTCGRCQAACERKPGWFLPGQAQAAADLLGVTLAELFTTRLAVDYWYGDDKLSPTTFVLTPSMCDHPPGEVLGLDHGGRCTFYVDGRCQIHDAKPFECHQWYCEADPETLTPHVDIARAWTGHQDEITNLLGREPEVPDITLGDLIEHTFALLDRIAGPDRVPSEVLDD